jgi:hypothetical protein
MILIEVSSIDHDDTYGKSLYRDTCFDDHSCHCSTLGIASLFEFEMVCSILGEQLDSDLYHGSSILEIPECIDLFIGEVPDDIVWWEWLILHKLRDTVIRCGEPSFEVECMLCFEDIFT